MKFSKRKFIKILCFSSLALLFPIETLLAATKKIVNPNLSKEQKNIMFNEGTERPFTSNLLKEKRKGFYHCANCGNKLFASNAKEMLQRTNVVRTIPQIFIGDHYIGGNDKLQEANRNGELDKIIDGK